MSYTTSLQSSCVRGQTSKYGQDTGKIIVNTAKLSNSGEARQFLRDCGLTVNEEVVREIVNVLRSEGERSLYNLYAHGRDRDGVERKPIRGKGTAYKVKALYDVGTLDTFLAFLDSGEESETAITVNDVAEVSTLEAEGARTAPARLDSTVLTGRNRHFEMLTEVGRKLREDLETLTQAAHPVYFSASIPVLKNAPRYG